ncbi:unnamed protein product [Meloidogyne enterolobii]
MRIIIQNCIEKTIGEGIKNKIEPDTLGCIVSCDLFYDDVCSPICEMSNNNTLDDILDGIIGKAYLLRGEPFTVTVTGVNVKGLPKRTSFNNV